MRYKVGDKVRIKSIDWHNENKDEDGDVLCGEIYFSEFMTRFCGKIMTIAVVNGKYYRMIEDKNRYQWTYEMIEGLVEETPNSKYKIGDFVGVSGYESDVRICNIKWNGSEYIYQVFLADEEEWLCEDDIVVVEEETKPKYEDEIVGYSTPKYMVCPSGYQFADENGNVINATKIVLEKKKPKYPTTYEECCKVLDLLEMMLPRAAGWNCYKINALQKLLICRDAYRKIAGEEMGLGKPWKPDWYDNYQKKWTINFYQGEIHFTNGPNVHRILAFPTEEMRDAFKESEEIGKLIEDCKELL